MLPLRSAMCALTIATLSIAALSSAPLPASAHATRSARASRARARRRTAERAPAQESQDAASEAPSAPPERVQPRVVIVPPVPEAHLELGEPRAEAPEPSWRFELSLATHAPVALGVEVALRPPAPVFFQAFVGWTIEPYARAIDTALSEIRLYESSQSPHVVSLLTHTTMTSVSVGLTPHEVLDVAAGYTLLHRAASLPRELVLSAAGNHPAHAALADHMPERIPVELLVHLVHFELAARVVAFDHLVVRFGLRWDHPVAATAHTHVDAAAHAHGHEAEVEQEVEAAEVALADTLARYTFFPSLTLAVGYQF